MVISSSSINFWLLLSLSSGSVFAADEIISALVDQETTITTVVSEEVGAFDSDTGVKRQDQQQAFDKADSLDQAWKDKIDELKTPESNLSLVVDHVKPNDAQNFEFQNPNDSTDIVDVKVENVDIKDVSNTADLGTKSSDGYQYKPKLDLPGSGANTYNGDTMQDFARFHASMRANITPTNHKTGLEIRIVTETGLSLTSQNR